MMREERAEAAAVVSEDGPRPAGLPVAESLADPEANLDDPPRET
jgi:hypothetical protein